MTDTDKLKPSEPKKRPVGRPPKLVVKIDDSPENTAKALFGIRSDKPRPAPKED